MCSVCPGIFVDTIRKAAEVRLSPLSEPMMSTHVTHFFDVADQREILAVYESNCPKLSIMGRTFTVLLLLYICSREPNLPQGEHDSF